MYLCIIKLGLLWLMNIWIEFRVLWWCDVYKRWDIKFADWFPLLVMHSVTIYNIVYQYIDLKVSNRRILLWLLYAILKRNFFFFFWQKIVRDYKIFHSSSSLLAYQHSLWSMCPAKDFFFRALLSSLLVWDMMNFNIWQCKEGTFFFVFALFFSSHELYYCLRRMSQEIAESFMKREC